MPMCAHTLGVCMHMFVCTYIHIHVHTHRDIHTDTRLWIFCITLFSLSLNKMYRHYLSARSWIEKMEKELDTTMVSEKPWSQVTKQ